MEFTCEQAKEKLSGTVNDRVELAKSTLPDECACVVFDDLSKDKDRFVRFTLSKNTELPNACDCEIFGRLSKDRDSGVRTFTGINKQFREHCGGIPDTKQSKWYNFDVELEEINCKRKCNIDVLNGQLSADTDTDVISIINTTDKTKEFLESKGFIEKPVRLTWYRTLDSLDEYIRDVKKGRDIRRGLNSLEKGKRNEDVEIVFDVGLKNEDNYRQWYEVYKNNLGAMKRGRIVLKEFDFPRHMTAMYAIKDGRVIGGRLFNEFTTSNSIAYSAFEKGHKFLDEIAYAKIIEYTLNQNKRKLNLGVDTNFYGYHMSPGVYKSKTLFGFTPMGHEPKGKEMFLVRRDNKFDDAYMFLSTDGRDMEKLKNNIFVKGKKEFDTDNYFAPHGIEIKRVSRT